MRNRKNEIVFDKDYDEACWEKDSKALDSLLELVEPNKRKFIEDLWVGKINNRMKIQADHDIKPHLRAGNILKAGPRKLARVFWKVIDNSTDRTADSIKEKWKRGSNKPKVPFSLDFGLGKETIKVLKGMSHKQKWLTATQIANKTGFEEEKVVPILENLVKKRLLEHKKEKGLQKWRTIIKK